MNMGDDESRGEENCQEPGGGGWMQTEWQKWKNEGREWPG